MELTKLEILPRQSGGAWAGGTMQVGKLSYTFSALVFPEHAECEEYELDQSCISKLEVRRDYLTVFRFDRGLDMPANNKLTQQVVDFLAAGLADVVDYQLTVGK